MLIGFFTVLIRPAFADLVFMDKYLQNVNPNTGKVALVKMAGNFFPSERVQILSANLFNFSGMVFSVDSSNNATMISRVNGIKVQTSEISFR